jgi:hypothetical protein
MAPEHFTWQIRWSCLCDLTSWLYSSCIMQSIMLKHYCQQHHLLCILFKFYVCLLKTEWKAFIYFCVWPIHKRYYINILLHSPSKTKKVIY